MSTVVPFLPDSAPFSAEQRAWLNGFLAGLYSRGPGAVSTGQPASTSAALVPVTVLFGSQTGTAEGLARRIAREAGKRGFAATVMDIAQMDAARLAAEKNVLLITSTYGDGEPPDSAKALHAALGSVAPASQLSSVRFSVCALGDTNYTQFCRCGADFDHFLEKLGATRVAPRVDCDLDYEEKFSRWLESALGALKGGTPALATASVVAAVPTEPDAPSHSRRNPFPARLLTSRNLNGVGSAKQVHHVEFDLTGSGLTYEAGDALGVVPHNCPAEVAEILAALGCDGEEAVPTPDGASTSLRRALVEMYDLGRPSSELAALLAAVPAGGAAAPRHEPPFHVIDALLASRGVRPAPTDFVRALRKLQPRLYSISSSPRAHAGQVHLTVGAVRYEFQDRARQGVCSTFLADRAMAGDARAGVFVHSNKAFRLPENDDVPVIMVGPGTGIAPFRGFLHERRARGARGRNWLIFGDQRAATDFLYHDELAGMAESGHLTRLDTAFSRDQEAKVYVQHRMLEHAAVLFEWLEGGAHFYVCGDASRMAKDVDAALHAVVAQAGGRTPDQAAEYVQALKAVRRYARDVY